MKMRMSSFLSISTSQTTSSPRMEAVSVAGSSPPRSTSSRIDFGVPETGMDLSNVRALNHFRSSTAALSTPCKRTLQVELPDTASSEAHSLQDLLFIISNVSANPKFWLLILNWGRDNFFFPPRLWFLLSDGISRCSNRMSRLWSCEGFSEVFLECVQGLRVVFRPVYILVPRLVIRNWNLYSLGQAKTSNLPRQSTTGAVRMKHRSEFI